MINIKNIKSVIINKQFLFDDCMILACLNKMGYDKNPIIDENEYNEIKIIYFNLKSVSYNKFEDFIKNVDSSFFDKDTVYHIINIFRLIKENINNHSLYNFINKYNKNNLDSILSINSIIFDTLLDNAKKYKDMYNNIIDKINDKKILILDISYNPFYMDELSYKIFNKIILENTNVLILESFVDWELYIIENKYSQDKLDSLYNYCKENKFKYYKNAIKVPDKETGIKLVEEFLT